MDSKYKKILPEDVFVSMFEQQSSKPTQGLDASEDMLNGNRLAGNDFMNLFVRLLREHGHKRPMFYARLMGVKPLELCESILAMSGITADEWIWRYLHLASRELLQKTKMKATDVSKKLGFSSLNTFTRYFYRMEGIHPSEYRNS